MKILVVDDIETNRKLLRAQLEAEGHDVLLAVDGVAALEVLEREPVDAVISDILMPRMDGYRLCNRIRQHQKLCALPIILYTSTYESASDREMAASVGADRYLIKPASTPIILQTLHEAMQQASQRILPSDPPPDEAKYSTYTARFWCISWRVKTANFARRWKASVKHMGKL